ncbi:MAG: hypothetical protein NTU94_07535 [Planctomycetota bacterium]|nr:hypothetical protein [Planctomycetota bacterium]
MNHHASVTTNAASASSTRSSAITISTPSNRVAAVSPVSPSVIFSFIA